VLATLVAVSLLACGVYSYRTTPPPAPVVPVSVVVVEEPDRDVGERPVGKSPVVFRVTNGTGHEAEVVGVPACCGKNVCLKSATAERQKIPPGGAVEVTCELSVTAPGAFEIGGTLYLNDNGLRVVNLNIVGTGREP
jgi:hypothetical protein